MTDAVYADNLTLFENTSVKAESEQAEGGIANKTDWMSFNGKKKAISTRCDKPLISVDKFTYLGSNILSTENDANITKLRRGLLLMGYRLFSRDPVAYT